MSYIMILALGLLLGAELQRHYPIAQLVTDPHHYACDEQIADIIRRCNATIDKREAALRECLDSVEH